VTKRFDAVLFDAGGVLVLPDPTVLAPLLARYGASTDDELVHRRAHYAGMKAKSDRSEPEQSWDVYDVAYVAVVGVDPSRSRRGGLRAGSDPVAVAVAVDDPRDAGGARRTRRAGVPMGVVSNASGQIEAMLRREICQVGPGDHVEMRCIVDSHLVGVTKPDPAIFDHALAYFAEFERSRIVYVGDSVTMDIGAATRPDCTRSCSTPTTIIPTPTSSASAPSPTSPPNSPDTHSAVLHVCVGFSVGRPTEMCTQTEVSGTAQVELAEISWRAMTLRQSVSSAPSKIDSTRASTK
jgi:FMN phosphatase YigB (HAD superfamily)